MARWFDRALVASGRSSISIAHDLAEKGSHGNMLRAAVDRARGLLHHPPVDASGSSRRGRAIVGLMEVSLDLRFHHVGLACEDIEVERAAHRLLGYTDEGLVFVDPRQRIRGCFMVQGGMRIELLQPEGEGSPLRPHLTRGIKMYHQAFETDAIEASIDELRRGGAALAVPPTPAVAFGGRPIAFLMLRTTMLVELIQAPPAL
jgi:methylmalonyl-CoA/ethylmalonyl-CoA epimerase